MDLSTDSQVEFELHLGASDGNMTHLATDEPQQAAVNAVTSGETGASTLATATITTATEAKPTRATTDATAPGDGDLLPQGRLSP